MSDEGSYYCTKCKKTHSYSYNVHYKYAVDIEEKLEEFEELKRKIAILQDKIKNIKELLQFWEVYMKRHHPYWDIKENIRADLL